MWPSDSKDSRRAWVAATGEPKIGLEIRDFSRVAAATWIKLRPFCSPRGMAPNVKACKLFRAPSHAVFGLHLKSKSSTLA
jgi:hypothetical protein